MAKRVGSSAVNRALFAVASGLWALAVVGPVSTVWPKGPAATQNLIAEAKFPRTKGSLPLPSKSNGGYGMRQIFLLVSVLLLSLSWALAQDATQGSTTPARGTNPMNSGQNSAAAGEKTVTGCLSGSNGSFSLTDKHGNSYQLTGDNAKLSEHVGHEVRVTGTPSPSASGATAGAPGTTTAGNTGAEQSLQVTSLKHISKSCQAGAGGMTH